MVETLPSSERALLVTLEEIGQVLSANGRPTESLQNIVGLIRERFGTDVCSVYLLEPDRKHLVLAASVGLRPDAIGRVRMRCNEGLVGLIAEQMRPQAFTDAARHPRFKFFPEAGEEIYHTLFGVPLVDRGALQGVLVVQTAEPREFSGGEISMLVAATAPVEPPGQRTAGPGTLCRAGLRTLAGVWPTTCGGAGTARPTACFASWIRSAGANAITIPILLLRSMSIDYLEAALPAIGAAQPHQLRLSADARVSGERRHLGRPQCRRAVGPARGLFLGRVRAPRVGADLLGRFGHPLGRSHQERLGSGHPADRHWAVLRSGLFPPAARQQTAGNRKTIST